MTYHDEQVSRILKEQARDMGREATLIDASTIGIAGERVTTVVYELASLDAAKIDGRRMVERRAQIEIENPRGGNRTVATGMIVATHWVAEGVAT